MPNQINLEAEEKAIVSILEGSEELSGMLLGKLKDTHFGSDQAQQCFIRIMALLRGNHKLPSLSIFSEDVTLSDDARSFLKETSVQPILKIPDVDALVGTLESHRKYRSLLSGLKAVNRSIKDENFESTDAVAQDLEKIIMDLRSGDQETKLVVAGAGDTTYADDVVQIVMSDEDSDSRLYTGFGYFDKMCGGFRKPSVVVISGTTGGGKSVLRTQLCKNMYFDQHKSTCIVSMEMSAEEEVMRLLSNISKVPFEKIERHQMSAVQKSRVINAWEEFKQVGIDYDARFIFWPPRGVDITSSMIISSLRHLKLDVIVVDYISLLSYGSNKDEAQWQALGDMVREFKIASAALNCCFIILAQFDADNNRIKYSRAIQEHANVLWGWVYGEKERESGIVPIQQIKNRNAPPGFEFRLHFMLETMTIVDYEGEGYTPPAKTESTSQFSSPKPSPKNHPPKDFKGMKKDVQQVSKQYTYKTVATPESSGEDEI